MRQNKISAKAGGLLMEVRSTLDEVLGDPTLNERFGGSDQRLSTAQCGLAAAVTAKLQDRLLEQIKNSHNREIGIIGGFLKLYQTPVLQPFSITGPAQDRVPQLRDLSKWAKLTELFTWGNVLGGAAIVLIALAFYQTKLTSSYQMSWEKAEKELTTERDKVKKAQDQYLEEIKAGNTLQEELAKATTRANLAELNLKNLTANSTDLQKQMLAAIQDLANTNGEMAKQVAGSSSEKKYQNLWSGAQAEIKSAQSDLKAARAENTLLASRAKRCDDQSTTNK